MRFFSKFLFIVFFTSYAFAGFDKSNPCYEDYNKFCVKSNKSKTKTSPRICLKENEKKLNKKCIDFRKSVFSLREKITTACTKEIKKYCSSLKDTSIVSKSDCVIKIRKKAKMDKSCADAIHAFDSKM